MLLKVDHISKIYGDKKILSDVSFGLEKGEILGFAGPNGAGKTTTLKIITDLVRPDSGSIVIDDFDLKKEREKALGRIGAVIENPDLYGNFTGRENLKMMARIRRVPKSRIDEVIRFVGLTERIDDKVNYIICLYLWTWYISTVI